MDSYKPKGFTLIELLVVLGLIAILAVILILALQPQKIFQKARDSQRISDLKKLNDLITYASYVKDAPYVNQIGNPNTVYLSLPDSSSTCGSYTNELPSLPPDWQYHCSATPTSLTNGWIPFDFSSFSNLSQLPVDPINQPPYYYTYVTGGSYKLAAKPENNYSFAASDGGIDPVLYEIGNDLKLPTFQSGLVLYLPFDEGTGTIAYDYSGYGNHGTLLDASSTNSDGNTPPQWTQGKISGALEFDGVDDYVETPVSLMWDEGTVLVVAKPYDLSGRNLFVWTAGPGTYSHQAGFKSDGYVKGYLWDGGAKSVYSNNLVSANNWYHIAITWKSYDVFQLFLDGNFEDKTNIGLAKYSDHYFFVGKDSGWSSRIPNFFYGIIDEVRFYNRVLTDREIDAIYKSVK